jgi:RHS repeat-associated protein
MNQYSTSRMWQAMRKIVPSLAVVAAILGPCTAHADDQFNYSRASSFVYSPTTGRLLSQKVAPTTPALCVETTYTYDGYGNRQTALAGNCAGATGRALFSSRQSSSTYAAQAVTTSCTAALAPIPLQAGAFPTVSANALGHQESSTFDPRFGAVTSTTGPNCLTTKWQIDDFGRTVRESRADGTSTVTAYCYLPGSASRDVSSNSLNCPAPASTEIPGDAVSFIHSEPRSTADVKDGPFSRVYADGAGRKIRTVTEAFDGSTQPGPSNRLIAQDTDYNAQGAVVVTTQPYFLDSLASVSAGSTNSYGMSTSTYDALGRPTAMYTSDPQGSLPGVSFGARGSRQATVDRFTYNGLTTTMVNDQNKSQIAEKNIDGQVFRKTDALGAQIAYQYDAFGKLLKTKDALQNIIAITYDILGRKTTLTDPDLGVQNYDYNALGEIVWEEDPNQRAKGQSTTFAYDVLGRVTRRGEPEYVSTWTYDRYADGSACTAGIGKLCETGTDNGVSERVVYDAKGRPQQSSMKITNGPTFTTAVSYDPVHGRLANKTYPTGLRVTYGYTAGLGYLETLSNATTTYWRAKNVNAWGRLESQSSGNGVTTVALFDPQTGRGTELGAGAANSVFHHKYTYDSLSNLKTREDSNGAGNGHAVTESYGYDAVNRLNQYTISGPDMASPMTRTVDMQYNALGSLLYKSDVGNYTYPAAGSARPHAVTAIAGPAANSYQYDSNGNMVAASGGKYRNIAYTSFNLPDSNMGIGGSDGTRYTWQYDSSHARIKEVRTNTQGTRTTWILHPNNTGALGFEQEIDTAGTTTNRNYLSAGGVSVGMVTTIGAITNPTNPQPTDSSASVVKVDYWHTDNLGSISAITNAAGAVTQRMAYDPFGKRRDGNGSYDAQGKLIIDNAQGTDRGFTGHEQMDDIGIVHMNGRIYDANIGRFMQADPRIAQPFNLQNFDRYSYVLNNPLNLVDPSGFEVASGCATSADSDVDCEGSGGGGASNVEPNPSGGSYEDGYTTVTVSTDGQTVTVTGHRGPEQPAGCTGSECYNNPPMGDPSSGGRTEREVNAGEPRGGGGGSPNNGQTAFAQFAPVAPGLLQTVLIYGTAALIFCQFSEECRKGLYRFVNNAFGPDSGSGGSAPALSKDGEGEGTVTGEGTDSEGKRTPPNPDGQNGKQDHKDKVEELVGIAEGEAGEGETVLENKKVRGHDSNRRPDVQIVDEEGSTRKIFEAERKPNSKRNVLREAEYDRLKIPHETHGL